MPEDFSFQLYPDDLDRLEFYIEDAMARVPLLGTSRGLQGHQRPDPLCAPDGNPLIGPMPGVPNAFEACVFTFGIAQAGGAGKVLAEWIVRWPDRSGTCGPAIRAVSPITRINDYCIEKGMEVYGHEYAMHFPHHEWPAAATSGSPPCTTGLSGRRRSDGRL